MKALLSVVYGLLSYTIFLATILYAIGFVGNIVVPKGIDAGTPPPLLEALLVDLVLLGIFAVQHSGMARPGFKRWWTRVIPKAIERSTFVLMASLVLLLLYWQWRPIPQVVWSVRHPAGLALVLAAFWFGWGLLITSTFLIDHFELFGLRQVFARSSGREPALADFKTPLVYRYVRHPIYLGFLFGFWAAPVMSVGHLLFSLGTTGYIMLGIWFEERDLIAQFGDRYRRYREQVGMLLPRLSKRARIGSTSPRNSA